MDSNFVTMCLNSLRSYKGKDINKMLIFPYDNVAFKLSNYDQIIEKDHRYATYALNQLIDRVFYLASKDAKGTINIKVGKLANKAA